MSALEVRQISKSFGGVRVLTRVTLSAEVGAVTALIGPNGAGKSTLANVVAGFVRPDDGRIVLEGRDVTSWSPHRRARQGLGRTFQNLELFTDLSAEDNALLGRSAEHRGVGRWFRAPSRQERLANTQRLGDIGIGEIRRRRVDSLSFGQAKLVEPARVASMRPRVVVLDEPAAGLTAERTHELGAWITRLATDGVAVLLIEHNMSLVMSIADHIHALDHGETIATGTPAEISSHPAVLEAYLGAGFTRG